MKNKKKFSRLNLAILGIAFIMVASTTALSLAYWVGNQDLSGKASQTADVVIGEGKEVTLSLSLDDATRVAGLGEDGTEKLIPSNITLAAGETHLVKHEIEVAWVVEGEGATHLYELEGELSVTVASIMIDGVDYLAAVGLHNDPLFSVTTDKAAYDIVSGDIATATPVTVTVSIVMDEPVDDVQYLAIAGKTLTINLDFEITTEDVVLA